VARVEVRFGARFVGALHLAVVVKDEIIV